jgi:predicted small metal-binding protein
MQNEVDEQQPSLASGQFLVDAQAIDFDHQQAAQLKSEPRRQGGAKIRPRWALYKPRTEEVTMAKQINCECGYVARGNGEDEVIARIREHMRADHPELVDRVSDEDLRGWIEET